MSVATSPVLAPNFGALFAYFNDWTGRPSAKTHSLRFESGLAFGCYDDLRMYSAFQPILSAETMQPLAYEALLRAKDEADQAVSPKSAFTRPETPKEIVYFDRLCRTVHAVNFATQARPGELLFLNVDARHLFSVEGAQHGTIFEALLKYCGLKPTQIVLEILEAGIDDLDRLAEALAAYQQRGYRIAMDDFGCQHSNFDRLWRLSPDIVKLDRSLIVQSTSNPRAGMILPKLVDIIHDLGAEVVCEGIETAEQHKAAVNAGSDMLQGYYYAYPEPHLLPQPR